LIFEKCLFVSSNLIFRKSIESIDEMKALLSLVIFKYYFAERGENNGGIITTAF